MKSSGKPKKNTPKPERSKGPVRDAHTPVKVIRPNRSTGRGK